MAKRGASDHLRFWAFFFVRSFRWSFVPPFPIRDDNEIQRFVEDHTKDWFFRAERLELLKKMDMLCILEVTQIPPSRGKSCPPAYFITCSASVATSTAESIIMRVVRASPLSNLANAIAARNAVRRRFMPRDTRIASCKRCPLA